MTMVAAVLGIDAAWTASEPSGVALLEPVGGGWRCVAAAPSYAAFRALGEGRAVDWCAPHVGSVPNAAELLRASADLSATPVRVVAVDMPLALDPITRRRAADNAISREYAARKCGTHSPSAERPGPLSDQLREQLESLGFPLATAATPLGQCPALVETYPHPALLRLCAAPSRLPYKVAKWRRYWPDVTREEAVRRLLAVFHRVLRRLRDAGVRGIDVPLPQAEAVRSPRHLKPYEDAIDAVVSAWVGTEYLRVRATPFGDATAAIWVPT